MTTYEKKCTNFDIDTDGKADTLRFLIDVDDKGKETVRFDAHLSKADSYADEKTLRDTYKFRNDRYGSIVFSADCKINESFDGVVDDVVSSPIMNIYRRSKYALSNCTAYIDPNSTSVKFLMNEMHCVDGDCFDKDGDGVNYTYLSYSKASFKGKIYVDLKG